jgi:hypothetical protein
MEPLAAARDWLDEAVRDGAGAHCPCCDRPAGYEVRLERVHVRELLRFYAEAARLVEDYGGSLEGAGIHVPTTLGKTATSYSQNCLSQCKHFGLVQPSGDKPGWWKLTRGGVRFVAGGLKVPRAAWVFRGELIHYVVGAGTAGVRDLVSGAEYDSLITGREEVQA